MACADAFNLLQEIKTAALHNATDLPHEQKAPGNWQGLGFLVGGVRLVSKLGDVSELMPMPRMTSLPGVKPWLLGIANVRGRLVPVIDLHVFLGLPATLPTHQWRVLLVEAGDRVTGLVVEQSLGIQHFAPQTREAAETMDLGVLAPFVDGIFRHAGRVFHEVHLGRLVGDERFWDVAERSVPVGT